MRVGVGLRRGVFRQVAEDDVDEQPWQHAVDAARQADQAAGRGLRPRAIRRDWLPGNGELEPVARRDEHPRRRRARLWEGKIAIQRNGEWRLSNELAKAIHVVARELGLSFETVRHSRNRSRDQSGDVKWFEA